MHILYISIESPYDEKRGGGIASYLRAIIPAMLARGHQVTLISHGSHPPTNVPENRNLRVEHITLPNLHWYLTKFGKISSPFVLPIRQLEWSIAFYLAAQRLLRENPADIIETAEIGALLFAFLQPKNLAIRLHGSDYIFRKFMGQSFSLGAKLNFWFEKYSLRRAHLVTSPSQFQAIEMAKLMGSPIDCIQVIPNPLTEIYLSQSFNAKKPHRPIVLFSGRLAQVKGIETLLKAIPLLKKACPRVLIVLAGELQMPALKLNRDVKRGLQEGLLWLGHQSQRAIMKWYQRSTVFVMPSYYETFGISCLEAMAFGLPVVATTVGGLPEVVEQGTTGILVHPGDPQALAEAVICLLNNPELRQRMGQNGRKQVLGKFTPQLVAKHVLTLYKKSA